MAFLEVYQKMDQESSLWSRYGRKGLKCSKLKRLAGRAVDGGQSRA